MTLNRLGRFGFRTRLGLLPGLLAIALAPARPLLAGPPPDPVQPAPVIAGDLDGDGRVDVRDAIAVLRAALGQTRLRSARALIAADLALPHGQLDAADVRAVLARALGMVAPETVPLPARLIDPADGAEMTLVPAGPFPMGSDKKKQEGPVHVVTLSAYYIDVTETTYGRYRAFVMATSYQPQGQWLDPYIPNGDNYPVASVTWFDADAYARWSGKALPTEAQWEKAARGTDGRVWPWGSQFDSNRLNWSGNHPEGAMPVGAFPSGASPYGALDMAGNVWEWVADGWDPRYYFHSPDIDPAGPSDTTYRIMRGGAWDTGDLGPDTASAFREACSPTSWGNVLGFRCVLPLDAPSERNAP